MYPSSKTSTKIGSVVENARQAREERAQYRRKEAAVVKIQSFTRGFLSRKALGTRWRNELDQLIGWDARLEKDQLVHSTSKNDVSKPVTSLSSQAIDKISSHAKQLSKEEWTFASFESNTLTGAYGNLTLADKTISKQHDIIENGKASHTHSKSQSLKLPTSTDVYINSKTSDNNTEYTSCDLKPSISQQSSQKSRPDKNSIQKTLNQEIFQIIQHFLHVFNPENDDKRFLEFSKYLLYNTENESSLKYSYVGLSVHKQLVLSWIVQVKTILWHCCKFLDISCKRTNTDAQSLLVHLRMLITFTDISGWKSLKKQVPLHNALSQMCTSFLCDLYQRGCLSVVGCAISQSMNSCLSSSSLAAYLTFTFRVLASVNYNDESVIMFVQTALTIPSLVWQINKTIPQCLPRVIQSRLLSRIVTLLHGENACISHGLTPEMCKTFSPVIDCLCIFANLLQMLMLETEVLDKNRIEAVALLNQLLQFLHKNTTQLKTTSTTWHPVLGYFAGNEKNNTRAEAMLNVRKQLEYLWNPKFVEIVFHDVLTLPSLHDETATPTQAEQLSGKAKQKTKFSDKFSSYLKKLASSRSQTVLLPTGGRKLEYAEVKNTCCGCLLFRRALSIVTKQLQLEMLTGLTFMNQVLCRMWRFICELGPSGGLQLFLSALTLPSDVAEPYFAVFTLFCDMTSHILSILDDVEFYDLQVPFHLEELVTISAFLRQFVFKVIWNRIVTDSHSPMYPVFDSAHSLLIMLYDRDARRSFTPNNHWLCKDVKPSAIRSEVEKSQPRAKLMLEKIPFVLPHKDRVILFRSFVSADKNALGISEDGDISVYIRVHRSRLVEDGFAQLSTLSPLATKGIIRVKFINDLGLDEAGIDQDGVFKEFLEEIIQKVFNPDMNLFKVTSGGESKLYPSPHSHIQDDHISLFSFIGKMLGKAVYEGIVLDIPFANFFLRNLLTQQHTMLYSPIDELPSLDAEFYRNLTWIKRYDGDISDLGLTFTYEEDVLGRVESHELVPGGSATPVTNENRIMYIHTLAHYRMHTQILQQSKAFVAGFRSIISHRWTAMFSAPELQRLISGDNVDMDLADLKRHVVYYGGFHSTHRVVRWLWDILEKDYTPQQRSGFLKFVTSCSRPPLLGFAHLNPQFSIRCVDVPDDEDTGDTMATVLRGFFRLPSSKMRKNHHHPHRLPTASTCFNLLKLPNYPSKDVLREKLEQAIANNTGFELS